MNKLTTRLMKKLNDVGRNAAFKVVAFALTVIFAVSFMMPEPVKAEDPTPTPTLVTYFTDGINGGEKDINYDIDMEVNTIYIDINENDICIKYEIYHNIAKNVNTIIGILKN